MTTDTENKQNTDNKNLVEKLFAAGSHFGFSRSRRHPTMRPYLYGSKHGTDIFDLEKTVELIEKAKEVLKKAGSDGKTVLFVGTKEEISSLVKERAEAVETPYVTNRWIGGVLTNFSEIKKRVLRLKQLTDEGESGELERKYTKRERVLIARETEKLTFNFGGIKDMDKRPDFLLIVDPRHDSIAINEARDLSIPVVAIMSSDNDVDQVQYPVILNDTLQASVTLALDELTSAYKEGKEAYVPKTPQRPAPTRRPQRS